MPDDFHRNGNELRDSFMNVMRHYDMIDGEATYAGRWTLGTQRLLLADTGGFFVPDENVQYRTHLDEGVTIARIFDLYGTLLQEITTPCPGQIFGLRSQACVYQGDWICFYGEVLDEISE